MVSGGAATGIATSTKRMVEMANREGMALELKDMDWTAVDTATLIQEEADRWERLMSAFFGTKTKQELLDEAVKKSMMLIPVSTIQDVVESPQLEAREFWIQVEHPELDEAITYPGWPIKMSGLPPYRPQRRAPLIGEHNEEVFEKEAGLSKEQVVILRTRGVI
jgi:crotonobetainyl-CoA:carnitine CoA-transferase CaiB-like acyl-CoA transferase